MFECIECDFLLAVGHLIIISTEAVMLSVCQSVCLCAELHKQLWMNFSWNVRWLSLKQDRVN